MTTGISLGLAIGMSLGVLFGIVTDNIGLGMMVGTAIGLCGGSAADALKIKKKETSDGEKKSDEKIAADFQNILFRSCCFCCLRRWRSHYGSQRTTCSIY